MGVKYHRPPSKQMEDLDRMDLADRIWHLRKRLGVTQQQLSMMLGLHDVDMARSVIANVESRRRLDLTVRELIGLSRCLGVEAHVIEPLIRTDSERRLREIQVILDGRTSPISATGDDRA